LTNPDYTHLAVVVDRSGSMATCYKDMIGGLDTFFGDQASQPGDCLVDYFQFDTEYESVFEDKPVGVAKAQLSPRGATALLDAIGKTVTTLGEKLAAKPEDERPGKVIVVIVTDGYENSSREWTKGSVKKVVETQRNDYNWDFVFLGANMDAVSEGASFGMLRGSSLTYDTHDTAAATASLSAYTTQTRSFGAAAFSDEDRRKNAPKS